jgi:hypothetical protein
MVSDIHIDELLASPRKYENQIVRVTGLFMYFQENQCLAGTVPDDDVQDFDPDECFRVWLDTDPKTEWIGITRKRGHYAPATVEGVYRHGACGHLNSYPGQLTQITSVVAAQA